MAVSLHFECMIEPVAIRRILNNLADILDQVYIAKLEAVGPVQLWRNSSLLLLHISSCDLIIQSFPHLP
jgi:hypothetical protein